MELHVGRCPVDEHPIDSNGRGRLIRSRYAAQADVDQGLLVGDVGVERDIGDRESRQQGDAGRHGDEEQHEGRTEEGCGCAGASERHG